MLLSRTCRAAAFGRLIHVDRILPFVDVIVHRSRGEPSVIYDITGLEVVEVRFDGFESWKPSGQFPVSWSWTSTVRSGSTNRYAQTRQDYQGAKD